MQVMSATSLSILSSGTLHRGRLLPGCSYLNLPRKGLKRACCPLPSRSVRISPRAGCLLNSTQESSGKTVRLVINSASASTRMLDTAEASSMDGQPTEAVEDPVPRVMIVSDLDNTMVDHQDKGSNSLLRFGALWAAGYAHDSKLVFSTGRSPTLYEELRSQVPLLTPDIAIMSVGTEIRYGSDMVPDSGWEEFLDKDWDREVVIQEARRFSQLRTQRDSEQRPHKISFHVDKDQAQSAIDGLSARLRERGLKVKLIYSGGIDLDVLPEGAGKGNALAYLLKRYRNNGVCPHSTLVCGDSGNDSELFTVPGVNGVVVGNAHEELVRFYELHKNDGVFRATERCASGIMQAMQHFGFQPTVSPRDKLGARPGGLSGAAAAHWEVVEVLAFIDEWVQGNVPQTEEAFSRLRSVMAPESHYVSPSGGELSMGGQLTMIWQRHGSMRGKPFRILVDRLQTIPLGNDAWLCLYHALQWTDRLESKRAVSAVLRPKDGTPCGLEWVNIHETWLYGFAPKKN